MARNKLRIFEFVKLTEIRENLFFNSNCNKMSIFYFSHLASPILNSYSTNRSRCSSNASSLSPLSCGSVGSTNHMMNNSNILPLAFIGDENFRLYELSAFIELKRTISSIHSSINSPYSETCSIYQHDLLRLHANDIQIKNLHTFETISIDQIFDKFPRYDGLKDLFQSNPDGSFYLIKFWADVSLSSLITNSNINRDESFFTSYSYTSCSNRPIHISTRLCSFGKQVLEKVEISEYPQRDQYDQFIYRFDRSPLCDYMVQFIQKLRSLPQLSMMNSVLEVRFLFSERNIYHHLLIIIIVLEFYNTSSD